MDIKIPAQDILNLNIAPMRTLITSILLDEKVTDYAQKIQLLIDFPREETDPRELSEIPEIRLWFVRLDAAYPWFPYLLDWKSGELARYTAMLVPHQFHRTEGIQFNPEALELFVMQKVFAIADWLRSQGMEPTGKVQMFAQMLGYELNSEFFTRI